MAERTNRWGWRWWISAWVALALAIGLGHRLIRSWQARSTDKITAERCEKIVEGMTQEEVEALLGGPAGVYTTDDHMEVVSYVFGGHVPGEYERVWSGNTGAICVSFDQTRHVTCKQFRPRPSRSAGSNAR